MRLVGVTGGIASGKSIVLNTFMQLGAYGIDCDILSREVVRPCSKAWWAVVDTFGKDILMNNLEIDRATLRRVVFGDSDKRRILERIIHPEVKKRCVERIEAIKRIEPNPNALVVVDVPLLIETRTQKDFEFDRVIVVYVREATQIRRVMEREGVTEEEAKRMIDMQMPLKEKLKYADWVINNEGTVEETEEQVRKVFYSMSGAKNPKFYKHY